MTRARPAARRSVGDPVRALAAAAREFGPAARAAKRAALDALARAPLPSGERRRELGAALDWLRAYPDDPPLRARVRRLVAALPARAPVRHGYSYEVVQRLVARRPGALEIDWDRLEDDLPFQEALSLLVGPVEQQGLDDQSLTLAEWFAAVRPRRVRTDLELFLDLLARSGLPAEQREFLFTRAGLPIAFDAPAKCRLAWPAKRIEFQRAPIARDRFDVRELLRQPVPRPARGGLAQIDFALEALAVRRLEIYPLIHATPADVRVYSLARGLRILVTGVRPERRSALESLWFFLVLKNEAPIAYGPAGVFCGVCEFGINVFPEFRGAEIRLVDSQLMRVLHQEYGARYFHLVRYAFGQDNPDAIRSGAFWFYRKLGFVPTNPKVEALARAEEARIAAEPGYRSDSRMLRRLSDTEGKLDLSDGRCRPFPFGALGVAHSTWLGREFAGDRARAARVCSARIARLLGTRDTPALRPLAPLLVQLGDVARWPAPERALLARLLRAKASASERAADPLFQRLPRLEAALRMLAGVRHQ